jgi:hypothetical protein
VSDEQTETGLRKGRGRAQGSSDLIAAMYEVAAEAEPITGRGIGYKLFTQGLIPDMSRASMQKVYRLLREAREEDIIPWGWIVDETRELERVATWHDPEQYAEAVARSYRRDFWNWQDVRVEVWSEKGTVRGVLQPVLDEFGVGFRVMHGYASATAVHGVAEDDDGRPLIVLYVGDYDPSGMNMSEVDLPTRLEKYDGTHVELRRIALKREQTRGLQSFAAADKKKDRQALLGAGRHGPQRPARDRAAGDRERDRAGGLGALQRRQRGRAGIAATYSQSVEGPEMTERGRHSTRSKLRTSKCKHHARSARQEQERERRK